jgi:predicted nucleic acid-binding protein
LIAANGPIAVTEPVIMEDAAADFEGAARIYRRCRQSGITPRGLVDCMIAAVARRYEVTLLACDIDLDRVARVIGVELDQPTTPERPSPAR